MKYNEIKQLYTKKVTDLIAKGYIVNLETMSGTQGEIAHIDLTDGTEVIRVLMDRDTDYECGLDKIVLKVGRCTDDLSRWATIWNNHLEIIEETAFCKVDEDGTIYCSEEEGKKIAQKRRSRMVAKWGCTASGNMCERANGEQYIDAVLPYVRRQPKMKSYKKSDITSIRRIFKADKAVYEIVAKGHTVTLRG